jgi:hypothetical protein
MAWFTLFGGGEGLLIPIPEGLSAVSSVEESHVQKPGPCRKPKLNQFAVELAP